jgi:UDP-N-acetylglucosamine 2-epimerase (non-hydrolysing)
MQMQHDDHFKTTKIDMNKTVITVTGIRPDFIRMSEIFKKLDKNFNHILVHTGQHFNTMLSDVFFDELKIRKPDYNLNIGGMGKEHYHQTADLTVKLIDLLRSDSFPTPDIIFFLGDSNSVLVAPVLRKEGYKIGHIEAGMRSHDKRMLEEINRTCCDHSSNLLFAYHDDYKQNLINENISPEDIFVITNTIVEVTLATAKHILKHPKKHDSIIVDIHRPENFKDPIRLANILSYSRRMHGVYGVPIKLLAFPRTMTYIQNMGLQTDKIDVVELMSYKNFLQAQYDSLFMISDSGTSQEESALLNTPVLVPRDFTERPQSYDNDCSFKIDVYELKTTFSDAVNWIDGHLRGDRKIQTEWLGTESSSSQIIKILKAKL